MARDKLRVGLVGTGFMGRAHSNAYHQVGRFFNSGITVSLQAVCARNSETLEPFADKWGYASTESDWKGLIARDDIDLVDIASPNNTHAEIAIAALKAGKMVACEKPLGMNVEESEQMADAARSAGVPTMVWYNYRRVPALTLAKKMVDDGALGRIFHVRSTFLQDWTMSKDLPQGGNALWRLDSAAAGSGVTGDLLAHCIDAAQWLNGPIDEVAGVTETFIKERVHSETGTTQPVTIDDASAFLARFANGALATFEATRYARGHKAKFTIELNGERGSLFWDLHDLHRLEYFNHDDPGDIRGWRSIHVTDGDHPYMAHWWVPGLQIGYEHSFTHQVADFLHDQETGKRTVPNFEDAMNTDRVTAAVLASARSQTWQKIKRS